jgi:teichuronic acid biosynthesis glycosyltransferase TuaG
MGQKELKKTVSIILPNFNSSEFVSSSINSIKNQTYKNWNLIIVDDCSNDKTKKILKNFNNNKKIKILWLKKNRGAAYCRNLAIKRATSKYLAFIDSDDIWEKNKLEIQLKYMEKNNFDFTYTYYKTFGLKSTKIKTPIKFDFNSFTKNTSIATSTMIIKKRIIQGAKFTETAICEDYFFKCQILKKIKYAYCLKKFLTSYRIRKNSMQGSKIKNFYWIWKINYKYNKFNILQNLKSLFFISFNSIKKYGFK